MEAEIGVFCILFQYPELLESCELKPDMFSIDSHKVLLKIMDEVRLSGGVPDYNTVLSKLKSNGKILEVPEDYLKVVKDSGYQRENLPEFCKQISNAYKVRTLKNISSSLKDKLTIPDQVDLVLDELEKQIDTLRDSSTGSVKGFEDNLKETWEGIVDKVNNPGLTGITTGLTDLDLVTGGYNPGTLWVVAGRPGMGKSADMCNSILKGAKAILESGEDEQILVFSLEMSTNELVRRMISIHTQIPLEDINFGTVNQEQLNQIKETIKYFKTLPIVIDDTSGTDERRFVSVTRKYNRTKRVRLVYLDYLQLGTERDEGQTQALGRFTRAGKNLAKDLKATCIFYSQLNRQVELRDDKRPELSDLRQSGNIEEDADVVKFLYRDEYYNKGKNVGLMEQDVKKHRNGKIGMFVVEFNGPTMTVKDQS